MIEQRAGYKPKNHVLNIVKNRVLPNIWAMFLEFSCIVLSTALALDLTREFLKFSRKKAGLIEFDKRMKLDFGEKIYAVKFS